MSAPQSPPCLFHHLPWPQDQHIVTYHFLKKRPLLPRSYLSLSITPQRGRLTTLGATWLGVSRSSGSGYDAPQGRPNEYHCLRLGLIRAIEALLRGYVVTIEQQAVSSKL